MFRPVSLYVGLRYTAAKRRNHFISFISLISIIGLTLGVAVLIVVLSVMNGFDRELQNRILGMIPHASLHGYQPIKDWQRLVVEIEEHPQVEAAAPFTQLQGMLTHQGIVNGAFISGVMPEYEKKVSIIDGFMTEGDFDALKAGAFNMILGQTLANQLGLVVGDKVTLVLPEASVTAAGVLPRFKRFTLVGTFEVGAELDGLMAVIHLQDAGKLLRHIDHAQAIRLKVDDLFQAPQLVRDVIVSLEGDFYPTNWTRTHGNLFQAIKMEKAMMFLLLLLIVAVAAFNIVSSLVMLVTDKKPDIAILRTLGMSPNEIRIIFMVQGVVIGVFGTVVGTSLGVAITSHLSDFVAWIEMTFNQELFSAYFVNYLPTEIRTNDVVIIGVAAFFLSFFATLYPSSRAAKTEPAEALRHE
jgi:lipoprotein-releasing system permease protein